MEWNFDDRYTLRLQDGDYELVDNQENVTIHLIDQMGSHLVDVYQMYHELSHYGVTVTLLVKIIVPTITIVHEKAV